MIQQDGRFLPALAPLPRAVRPCEANTVPIIAHAMTGCRKEPAALVQDCFFLVRNVGPSSFRRTPGRPVQFQMVRGTERGRPGLYESMTLVAQPGECATQRVVVRIAGDGAKVRPDGREFIVGHVSELGPGHDLKQSAINGRQVAVVGDRLRTIQM